LNPNVIVDNIPSFLQQTDTSSIGLGDILGVIIGSIALIVSAVTFYISHTQESQNEQIKTTRDIWERIREKNHKYLEEKMKYLETKSNKPEDNILALGAALSLLNEIDYLAYFIMRGVMIITGLNLQVLLKKCQASNALSLVKTFPTLVSSS